MKGDLHEKRSSREELDDCVDRLVHQLRIAEGMVRAFAAAVNA